MQTKVVNHTLIKHIISLIVSHLKNKLDYCTRICFSFAYCSHLIISLSSSGLLFGSKEPINQLYLYNVDRNCKEKNVTTWKRSRAKVLTKTVFFTIG